jgi:hypothetical protein
MVRVDDAEEPSIMLSEFGLADKVKLVWLMSHTCNSELDWERPGAPQVPLAGYNLKCIFCPFVLNVTPDVSEVPEELPKLKVKPKVTDTPLKAKAWAPILPPMLVAVVEDHV